MSKVTSKLQVTLKKARLRIFDQATQRQRRRQRGGRQEAASDRGWTREELYERGRAR